MGRSKSTKPSFPSKLHAMLEAAAANDDDNIVWWQPGGASFKVIDSKRFSKEILGRFFKQTQYKSFQRQLNLYGFHRVPHGPNKGGYAHKLFKREAPELCDAIERLGRAGRRGIPLVLVVNKTKVDSNGSETLEVKKIIERTEESIDYLQYFPTPILTNDLDDSSDLVVSDASVDDNSNIDIEMEEISLLLCDNDDKDTQSHQEGPEQAQAQAQAHARNTAPSGSPSARLEVYADDSDQEVCSDDDTISIDGDELLDMLHLTESYDCFQWESEATSATTTALSMIENQTVISEDTSSGCRRDVDDVDVDGDGDEFEHKYSFPYKLHVMLKHAEEEKYSHIVSWVKGGMAFKVHDPAAFVKTVMPIYFDQTKYESFRRQLNLYGFSREPRGLDRGVTSHRNFVQSDISRCQYIKRPAALVR